nr:hypothetical protein BaRGS_011517 [Batillaria attramentaria]
MNVRQLTSELFLEPLTVFLMMNGEYGRAGLDKIYLLTSSRQHSLRVDLEDWDGSTAYAEYWEFSISGPDDDYRLHASGYSGDSITASGSLQNNNQQFSTPDRDNDPHSSHCARDSRHGAWWYSAVCGYANLNGQYRLNGAMDYGGIMWYSWKSERSLKHVEMKMKPHA